MVGNHWLVNINWSYHMQQTNNAPAPKQALTYVQEKTDDKLGLYGKQNSPQLRSTKVQQYIL